MELLQSTANETKADDRISDYACSVLLSLSVVAACLHLFLTEARVSACDGEKNEGTCLELPHGRNTDTGDAVATLEHNIRLMSAPALC